LFPAKTTTDPNLETPLESPKNKQPMQLGRIEPEKSNHLRVENQLIHNGINQRRAFKLSE
jgi:hypothetical protein